MEKANVKIKKWGNSFGIIIPQKVIESEKVKEGDEINIFFNKEKSNVLKEMFGSFKFEKSTEQMMKEVDEELWGEN